MTHSSFVALAFGMLLLLGGCGVVPSAPDLWPFDNEYIVPGTPLGEPTKG